MRSMKGRIGLAQCLVALYFASVTHADSWELPATRAHFSENNRYCLIVIPGDDTLDPSGIPENHSFRHPANLLPHDSAVGILYVRDDDSIFQPVWISTLPYPNEPVGVLVHNEGKWVVMLDSWHRMGYGDNVVVILDKRGRTIRRLALADMLPADKIASFTHTISSIWWLCDARFTDESDQLEIRTASNGEMPYWSSSVICDDYLRLQLTTGSVISFSSHFDEVLSTYPDSCFDEYWCPTVRYFYYRLHHPDSTVRMRLDSLKLRGNQIDTLRMVYNCFSGDQLWELGAALQRLDRKVQFVGYGLRDEYLLLVEAHDEISDFELRDSFPVVVQLPDSLLTFPLAPYESTFVDAVLKGGEKMFTLGYRHVTPNDSTQPGYRPSGALSRICTPDAVIWRPTNVYLQELRFGTRIFIDFTRNLVYRSDY